MPEPRSNQAVSAREIAVSRVIEGDPPLVFQAFTDPQHLSEWWGPHGFSTTTHSFEFRPGGTWDFTMHGPDGTAYPNWIEWLEIAPGERIVLRHGATNDDPEAFTSTITFRQVPGGTEVTLRSEFPTRELRDRAVQEFGAIEGGEQTLGRLAAHVEAGMGGDS